jgi:hypothetical protein
MSKLIRTLSIGAILTAMSLAAMTTVAQANDQPAGTKAARRPPTERQVGKSWRHRPITSQAADVTLQRVQARERFSIAGGTPTQANVQAQPSGSSGQSSWLLGRLGALAAGLVLVGGLAVRAVRRAGWKVRPEQTT